MSHQEMINCFIARTGESWDTAFKYLMANYWSLSTAYIFYYVDLNEGRVLC